MGAFRTQKASLRKNCFGIYQVCRRVGLAAHLARIAVLIRRLAEWTRATDEAIRKEHAFLLVVGLLDRLRVDVAALAPSSLGTDLELPNQTLVQTPVQAPSAVEQLALAPVEPQSKGTEQPSALEI